MPLSLCPRFLLTVREAFRTESLRILCHFILEAKLNFSRLDMFPVAPADACRLLYINVFEVSTAVTKGRSTKDDIFLSFCLIIVSSISVHLVVQVFIINCSFCILIGYGNMSLKLTNLLLAEVVNLSQHLAKHHNMNAYG